VQLGCNIPRTCQQHQSCTSWDRNNPGDALDVSFSSSTMTGWVKTKTCTTRTVFPKTTSCTGSLGSQSDCNTTASQTYQQLVSQLFPNPPASAVSALGVSGTLTETIDREDLDGAIATTTTDTCTLAISNLPAPVTNVKPVCDCVAASPPWAPQGVFYDELSLWSRPLDPDELARMAASYHFTSTAQSVSSDIPPGKEQATGLAAHLLEAAGADLNLLASYIDAARGASYPECYLGGPSATRDLTQDRAGRNLRLVSVIEAEAARLASTPGASTAPWSQRYQADLTVLASNRTKVLQELQLLRDCKNPLNIPEEELPLFVGQVVVVVPAMSMRRCTACSMGRGARSSPSVHSPTAPTRSYRPATTPPAA